MSDEFLSDVPEEFIFRLPDGTIVLTGNIAPKEKVLTAPLFADAVGNLTRDQITKILADPNRKMGRKRFPKTHIKNQGRMNSCCPYSAAAVLEKSRELRGLKRVVLGPEFVYAGINGGRNAGAMLADAKKFLMTTGCPPVEFVKYQSYLKSQQSKEAFDNAGRFKILPDEVFGIHSDDDLASALALGFVVEVACQVTNAWMNLDANGVVYPTSGPGNHAIHVDDLRINSKGKYEYDHAGSWGIRYGQEGRGFINWNHLRTPSQYHEFFAVRSTTDDPKDPTQLPERAA